MNVLVVDDKVSVQESVTDLLSSQNYNIDTANNGLDALAKIQKTDYQLFVIDHLMPLMNGVQLTKNIKANSQLAETKIIFMTTQPLSAVKALAEYHLFDVVIVKPIKSDEFINIVNELIELELSCNEA